MTAHAFDPSPQPVTGDPVRIGILGCARIAPLALVRPARKVPGARVVAVASRRTERAERFARRHRIPGSFGSYDALLEDEGVEAVYIPLPNALHATWAIRALEAGKHVLCEKPLAASEQEAKRMAEAARRSGLVAMEAFHYRYHPLAERVAQISSSGELGELRRITVELSAPVLLPRDIRWDAALAGGATMDVGCYAVNLARFLAPGDPVVRTAQGAVTRRGVDRSFEAQLSFPREVQAVVRGSILGPPWARLEVRGTRGALTVLNPFLPQLFYRLKVEVDGTERSERVADGATYTHQLAAFVAAIRRGNPVPTDFSDAVETMRVLDQIRTLIGVQVG